VHHPNILRLLDAWEDTDGRLNIVTEFAEGGALAGHVAKLCDVGAWNMGVALKLMHDVARGVEFAHAQAVTHRDIKPANVLIANDGRAMLADFGLARDAGARATGGSAAIVGSPLWMAPEAFDGTPSAPAMDIWSLGVLLYQLACGDCSGTLWPFADPTAVGALSYKDLSGLVHTADPDWSRLPAATPPALVKLMQAMLNRSPARRPSAKLVAAQTAMLDATGGTMSDAGGWSDPVPKVLEVTGTVSDTAPTGASGSDTVSDTLSELPKPEPAGGAEDAGAASPTARKGAAAVPVSPSLMYGVGGAGAGSS